ncbi:hypothetical protein HPHPA5_1054 [Helicobacter pylori Hp A-5]|nr:hypothetical protein HPHPA5_1054 [Helicobacter pylori Hp A-5]
MDRGYFETTLPLKIPLTPKTAFFRNYRLLFASLLYLFSIFILISDF